MKFLMRLATLASSGLLVAACVSYHAGVLDRVRSVGPGLVRGANADQAAPKQDAAEVKDGGQAPPPVIMSGTKSRVFAISSADAPDRVTTSEGRYTLILNLSGAEEPGQ
jgi:hypothetical protein